jgi:hypothetical protein
MTEIAGMLGYQLALVSARDVIQEYLKITDVSWWRNTQFYRNTSALAPYAYLRPLLKDFRRFNEQRQKKIEIIPG